MPKHLKYNFFTTKEIKPTGWFLRQLRIQADGLCGNLDKVWPDVRDSAWIGGKCEGWERVPYWLDGFVPLAYLLEDSDMISRAKKYIDAIISFQREDGWICPCADDERDNYDTWAVLLIAKVLCVYYDCSGDGRVIDAVYKCLKNFNSHINRNTLRNWGAARWFEGLIPIYYVYRDTGEKWLLTLARKLRVQGFDWRELLKINLLDDCIDEWEYYSHVVNIAMMLKSEALWSLYDDIDSEEFADLSVKYLDKIHGTAAGHFNGDENLSGNSPVQGAELCSVVELMYSYEWLFAVSGNVKWLDRLESLAFNSLPAAVSTDMWTHQYDQMINQVACFPMSKQPFRTNNNVAHTFGLEPHFGCCTANFGQGFPKFALTSFMETSDGIASCALLPSVICTNIGSANVECKLITTYPFCGKLKYIVSVDSPVEFTLHVRIPGFAAIARINGKETATAAFADISKTWSGIEEIDVELEFETEIISRPNDMVCVRRGALLYSVPIAEKWEKVEYTADNVERKFPYCDYYIYPQSEWNYALAGTEFKYMENDDFDNAFDTNNPPVRLFADMCNIEWDFNYGHCDIEPKSVHPLGKIKKVGMIPYGCTALRITEIPFIRQGDNG